MQAVNTAGWASATTWASSSSRAKKLPIGGIPITASAAIAAIAWVQRIERARPPSRRRSVSPFWLACTMPRASTRWAFA